MKNNGRDPEDMEVFASLADMLLKEQPPVTLRVKPDRRQRLRRRADRIKAGIEMDTDSADDVKGGARAVTWWGSEEL
jgi:hypothetical protein